MGDLEAKQKAISSMSDADLEKLAAKQQAIQGMSDSDLEKIANQKPTRFISRTAPMTSPEASQAFMEGLKKGASFNYAKTDKDLLNKYPQDAKAGQLIGGLIPGIPLGAATGIGVGVAGELLPEGAGVLSETAPGLARVLQSTIHGAATGGVQGLAQNPEENESRLGNTVAGAGYGALLAGVPSAIGESFGGLKGAINATQANVKENAPNVLYAAKRLGIVPTPGMLSGSKTVQGLESSLEQSPSLAGSLVRKSTNQVREGIKQAIEDITSGAAPGDKFTAGSDVGKSLLGKFGEKISESQMRYEPFNQELPRMQFPPDSPQFIAKAKLADSVAKVGQDHLSLSHPLDTYSNNVASKIASAQTMDDIENIRKQVSNSLNAAYRSGDGNSIDALSKIQDHLADFRDDHFIEMAKQNMPRGGDLIGQSMVEEYKQTREFYKNMRNQMSDLGNLLGIKNKNPKAFIETLESIPEETLAKKIFDVKDPRSIDAFKTMFPDEFETLRAQKLQEFRDIGEKSPTKFINEVSKLSSRARDIIFEDRPGKINDLKLVLESLPEKMGPSGTPQGELFNQSYNPFMQLGEGARYLGYKTLSPFKTQTTTSIISPSKIRSK